MKVESSYQKLGIYDNDPQLLEFSPGANGLDWVFKSIKIWPGTSFVQEDEILKRSFRRIKSFLNHFWHYTKTTV
jgi:hypothetical protein